MENNLQTIYDTICYKTFLNVKHLTDGADSIVLKNFDYKDEEHQCVLAIIVACIGILGDKKLIIDTNFFNRKRLMKKYPAVGKITGITGKEEKVINLPDLLDFMRPSAIELSDDWFIFENIYKEYYTGKE